MIINSYKNFYHFNMEGKKSFDELEIDPLDLTESALSKIKLLNYDKKFYVVSCIVEVTNPEINSKYIVICCTMTLVVFISKIDNLFYFHLKNKEIIFKIDKKYDFNEGAIENVAHSRLKWNDATINSKELLDYAIELLSRDKREIIATELLEYVHHTPNITINYQCNVTKISTVLFGCYLVLKEEWFHSDNLSGYNSFLESVKENLFYLEFSEDKIKDYFQFLENEYHEALSHNKLNILVLPAIII